MNSFDFRQQMIEKVRAFDTWVWKDSAENPESWKSTTSFEQWFDLFKEFISE